MMRKYISGGKKWTLKSGRPNQRKKLIKELGRFKEGQEVNSHHPGKDPGRFLPS